VVDDEANIRELARFALERAGHAVLTAGDGVEALEVFKANSDEIDAVVLDLTMPRMDGIETLKELLQLRPGLPVILSSGYSEHEASERLAGLGLAGFLGKPYRPTDLLQALRRALALV
jgi:CheY-like chemotaxis protein